MPAKLLRSCALLMIACLAPLVSAENWPQWRGPRLDGVSQERNIPIRWNKNENIAWRVALPGPAGSSPVIWDNRIFLTSVDSSGGLLLLCIGTDGQRQWEQVVTQGNKNVRNDEGNSASASPSTDGKHVWTLMANGVLAGYTVEGREVWKFDVQDRYGELKIQFGLTSTPVLDRGRLYLQLIHGDMKPDTEEARLVCLDAVTGREIWEHSRVTGAAKENEHSYSSPTLYRDSQREYLVTHGGDYVSAHALDDGHEIWRYCLNRQGALYHPTLRFVASPLATAGFVVAPSAKDGPIVCIRGDSQGDISDRADAIKWIRKKGTPDVPSPLYHEGLVYLCRENGNLVCVDAENGNTLYENRTTSDRYRASPLFADGHIYVTSRKGIVTVVKAGREFDIVAQNDLGEQMSASPVVSNGRLYLRTFDALYAVGKGAEGQRSKAAEGKTGG